MSFSRPPKFELKIGGKPATPCPGGRSRRFWFYAFFVVVVVITHQLLFSRQRRYEKSEGESGIRSRLQPVVLDGLSSGTDVALLSTFFRLQANQPAIGSSTKRRLHQSPFSLSS